MYYIIPTFLQNIFYISLYIPTKSYIPIFLTLYSYIPTKKNLHTVYNSYIPTKSKNKANLDKVYHPEQWVSPQGGRN